MIVRIRLTTQVSILTKEMIDVQQREENKLMSNCINYVTLQKLFTKEKEAFSRKYICIPVQNVYIYVLSTCIIILFRLWTRFLLPKLQDNKYSISDFVCAKILYIFMQQKQHICKKIILLVKLCVYNWLLCWSIYEIYLYWSFFVLILYCKLLFDI